MPRLTVWTIRVALIDLGIGFTLGGLLLFNKGVRIDLILWRLLPVHIELVLIGWMVRLAMSVAFWILPRLQRTERYGNVTLAWLAFLLLNGGVWAVAAGAWFDHLSRLILVGRSVELAAVMLFAVYIWARIKSFGG